MQLIIPFLLVLITLPANASTNPMEQLLQKQIAEKRYQKMRTNKQYNSYKTPPHKIVLIAGIGKKLYAHLITPQKNILIVRKGSKVIFDNIQFDVVFINTRCVILKHGKRKYEIPFIAI